MRVTRNPAGRHDVSKHRHGLGTKDTMDKKKVWTLTMREPIRADLSAGMKSRGIFELSLILPVHNQANIIEPVYKDILITLNKLGISYECILVENGSTDDTKSVVFHLAKTYPNTQAFTAPKGYGSAVLEGITKARGTYICYMPSDGQIDLSVLTGLWRLAKSGHWDVVKVKRVTRETYARLLFSRVLAYLTAILFWIPPWDMNGSPRIVLRSKITQLHLTYRDSFIDIEFAVKAHALGWKIMEIPMKTLPRYGGVSTRSWRTFAEFLKNLWKFRFEKIS